MSQAVFLTHAHPDHIGTAYYFREKYGAAVYASEGERAWIEDIDLQFAERPIPNFYLLAGRSVAVDYIVKEGDVVALSDRMSIQVIETPGHSVDEVSYRIDDAKELIAQLEEAVAAAPRGMENTELVDWVCERWNMPMLKTNPLFARTLACCRKDRK